MVTVTLEEGYISRTPCEGEDDKKNVPDPDLQAGNSQVPHGSCCNNWKMRF